MVADERTGEVFLRVVGRRTPPPLGAVPPVESRAALTSMAGYRTRVPKGILRYRSHAEMTADRLRWTVDAMVERARGG